MTEAICLKAIWLENDDFKRKYESKFSTNNSAGVNLGYVAIDYDTLKLLDMLSGKILKAGNKLSSKSLMVNFPGFSFNGILGETHISSARMTDRGEKGLHVQNGIFVVAWSRQ